MAYPGFPVYPAPMPLAGAQQAHIQPGGGIGQRLRQFTGNNQAMLMALGAGLLGNRENATANPLSTAVLGAMQGGQLDQQRREREEAEAEAEAQKNSTVEWLTKYRGMSPEEALATVQSGMVTQAIQQPAESKWLDVDGRLARLDPGAQQPEWFEPPNSGGLFDGKSVEGQGLNWLIENNIITQQQAANLAAGKTVHGPNAEVYFMTPEGLFSQPPEGGPPQPVGGGSQPGQQQQGSGLIEVTPGRMTDTQSTSATYADRMRNSDQILTSPTEDGQPVELAGASLWQRAASGMPLGNYVVTETYQKFDQAKRDFINAVLRRESGAVISDEEFANANVQYFPMPGDTEAVIRQKRGNRQAAIDGVSRSAGPMYSDQPTESLIPPDVPRVRRYNPQTGRIE